MTATDKYPANPVLHVEAGTYHYNQYPTASWWSDYELIPGDYPMEYRNSAGQPINPADHAAHVAIPEADRDRDWYARYGYLRPHRVAVSVPMILRESYFVNRLFTASSVDHKTDLNEPTTRTLDAYAYLAEDGFVMISNEDPTPSDRWHRKPIAWIVVAPETPATPMDAALAAWSEGVGV